MPKATSRPYLPTSSSDFALPPSSSSNSAQSTAPSIGDDPVPNPLSIRFRRPSLLAPKSAYFSEGRLQSPLAASFTLPSRRRRSRTLGDESESDRERMTTDSSPGSSSENPTPPMLDDLSAPKTTTFLPSTPPRRTSISNMDTETITKPKARRLSFPIKQPRILNLLAESRPEEIELKSEAAFQRLVSAYSELPIQPRTPRSATDRGRYPEEAGQDDPPADVESSDDGEDDDITFAFLPSSYDPMNINKPGTPASSVNGDELSMNFMDSPNIMPMDIDMSYGSPSTTPAPIASHWRYTPPPTTSAVRSNKRKFDDRYDPYANASKRRAVSPSISYLRESHPSLVSPILNSRSAHAPIRLPISIPISIPNSVVSSASSSPTIGNGYSGMSMGRPLSIGSPSMMSSPILRPAIALGSPILRPRGSISIRRDEEEEREMDGAGDAVGSLTLV